MQPATTARPAPAPAPARRNFPGVRERKHSAMLRPLVPVLLLPALVAPADRPTPTPPAGATGRFAPAAPAPSPKDLTAGARRRIDRLALRTPHERTSERAVDLA